MRKIDIIFWLGLMCIMSCQPATTGYFPPGEIIVNRMEEAMTGRDLPAVVAIAVNQKGEQVSYTYGNAVWDEKTPVTTHHIFRIASMTKLVTSIAALQLVENGKIGMDDDLANVLPEMSEIPILFAGKLIDSENPITLRHLLTHTSGFGYAFTDEELANFDKEGWEYKRLPRRFESGTQFLYGTSTDWTGELVEKISQLSLEEYFREHITGPLNMNRTWFNVPDSLKNEIVSYGRRGEDGMQPLAEIPNRIPQEKVAQYSGGGGLFASPEDYSKLLVCLLNNGQYEGGQLLKKSTIDEMFSNQIGDIVMDTDSNYFHPGVCCNFNGLIKKSSKWGLAGLIDREEKRYGRKVGTLSWGGVLNTYFFVDRASGIAASMYTQYLPFNHPEATSLFEAFSEIIYTQN